MLPPSDKPEWTSLQEAEVYGFLNGSANLSCQADAEPTPFFTWLRDGQLIERQDHYEAVSTEKMSVLQVRGHDV